jgi:hypothetical protein
MWRWHPLGHRWWAGPEGRRPGHMRRTDEQRRQPEVEDDRSPALPLSHNALVITQWLLRVRQGVGGTFSTQALQFERLS